jgi:hypothetical protein
MPVTLLRADAARLGTGLHDRAREFRFELGLPAEDVSGGDTHITAVQAQPDAADQGGYVVLGEVSVRAGGAALRAVEAGVDTRDQYGGLDRGSPRMRLQQLLSMSHNSLPSADLTDSLAPSEPGQAALTSPPLRMSPP